MRVLFLSNFYPPHSRGGYEQWCQEVALELTRRGHTIRVLTSNYAPGKAAEADPSWVDRGLFLEMELSSLRNAWIFFTQRSSREWSSLMRMVHIIQEFGPDAILFWGMWNLPRILPAAIEKTMSSQMAYYMGDFWPTLPDPFKNYWEAPARSGPAAFFKALLKPFALRELAQKTELPLKLRHVIFPSEFMQAEFQRLGINPEKSEIVRGGVNTAPYLNEPDCREAGEAFSLLYVGRLEPQKGVHLAIQAMGILAREPETPPVKLTIVGSGEPDYLERLHALAASEGLATKVTFLPAQPAPVLPAIYHRADALLFTSIWPEPFGRVIVEAMASGLPVVGSPVGGAAEILREGETALTFRSDDPQDLSRQIKRLIESPVLRESLGRAGRETAAREFDIQRMTDGIEASLQDMTHP